MDIAIIEKANEQIKKIVEWINGNAGAFGYMDLKLHEASYYAYSQMENDFPLTYKNQSEDYDEFQQFCEIQYNLMEDVFNGQKWEFKRYQLGRASSFYLHDGNIVKIHRGELDISSTIYNLIYENGYNKYIIPDITEDGKYILQMNG